MPESKPAKPKNSTHEFLLQRTKELRDAAIAAVKEYETIEVSIPKLDPKSGNPVLDSDGHQVLVTKKVLKRHVIAAEWADRIADAEKVASES